MLQLDVKTLLVALFASFSLATVCLAYVWRFTKTYRGFGIWVGAMALIGVGQFLLAGRGILPDPVSIVGGNTLAFVGFALLLNAGSVFLERGPWGHGCGGPWSPSSSPFSSSPSSGRTSRLES